MIKSNLQINKKDPNQEEEITLKILFEFILRNKFLILSFSTLFFLISILFAFSKKNIWEGRFQIVVDSDSANKQSLGILDNLNSLSSLGLKKSKSLKTEIAILESPSVLMPVFEFVNDKKNYKNSDVNKPNFESWKNDNLTFNLKSGTSVLNISYRDSDKNLIEPVLNKISKIYQDYSGASRKRQFKLGRNYLNKQISTYKIASYESIRKAQEYAMEQDLTIIDLNNNRNISSENLDRNNDLGGPFLSNIGIENIRVNAANKIRNIDIQIQKINNFKDDVKQLQYIGSTIAALKEEGLPQLLEDIETELIELRSKYTENDPSIKRLLKKRELFVKLLKERSLGYLNAEKMVAESTMISAMRPKGVLLKYKELIREANRDENTLIGLENQLKKLNLEESRLEDPWKLITNPTLKENPVAPKRKKISFLGLILGSTFGILISFAREQITK